MKENKNILIVGVGGQGILTASRVIANLVISKGFDVKTTEIHGMSQRGGSVYTMIRYGQKVYSPVIAKKNCDFLISFELMETFRWLDYCHKDSLIIINEDKIPTPDILQGKGKYPVGLLKKMKSNIIDTISIEAGQYLEKLGSKRSLNMLIMGIFAKNSDFGIKDWEKAIKENTPKKYIDLNLMAFKMGYEYK